MKNLCTTLLLLFSISVSHLINANNDTHEEDRNTLKNYLSTFEQALNDNDLKKIIPLLEEDVVIVFVNAEVSTGISEVIEYHKKVLGSENALLKKYSTKATASAPARFFGNTAIAHGTTLDSYTLANGEIIDMQTVWNVTLTKDDVDSEWKIAQLHFSANPFDNPVMNAIEDKIVWIGLICGILGLLLGFFINRFRKKV